MPCVREKSVLFLSFNSCNFLSETFLSNEKKSKDNITNKTEIIVKKVNSIDIKNKKNLHIHFIL